MPLCYREQVWPSGGGDERNWYVMEEDRQSRVYTLHSPFISVLSPELRMFRGVILI